MKKYNLVVPIAGKGSRMINGGFELPKPMLICGDKSILEWSMSSIDYSECNVIFIVRDEHRKNFAIDDWLKHKFGEDISIRSIESSDGATQTIIRGLTSEEKQSETPLIVYCPDTTFEPGYTPKDTDFKDDGLILTFKANSNNYSYVKLDHWENVIYTREKEVISDYASVGVYCFKSTKMFNDYAVPYVAEATKETHICPLYNDIIGQYKVVRHKLIDKIHIMGTPEEFKFFEEVSYKYLLPVSRKFALCCDHSGFELKQKIMSILNNRKIEYIDFGCYGKKDCDYNLYVDAVANYTLKNKEYFGIGICRSGQGVNICANKYPGIRACLIPDQYHAQYAIKHNAGNFFSLSSHNLIDNKETLWNVINTLWTETFDGGRHQTRMMKNG